MAEGFLDKWSAGVNNIADTVNDDVNSALDKATEWASKGKSSEQSGEVWGSDYDPSKLKIRDKLVAEMPDWLQRAGVMKIDFGSAFLTNPEHEQAFSLVEGVAQDVAGSIAGAAQFVTPEARNLAIDTLTFIVTNFVSTVTGYATSVFKKYASPDFAIQIATDITKKTLAYTTDNLENPADILKRYMTDPKELYDDQSKKENAEKLKLTLANVQETIADVTGFINKWGEEIRAYSEPIAKGLQYGPDYVLSEVESIYGHYLKQGIGWTDEQLGKIEQLINEYIDFAAQEAGVWAAGIANQMQEAAIREAMNTANKAITQVKIVALSIVNKVTMQLMSIIGG